MTRDLFLGLDVGTQGTKGVLLDATLGQIVGRASSAYGLIEGLPEGAAEQHPDTWSAAIANVVRALDVDAQRLAGIGVSGQQHGCVPLDADGRVLRAARLWCDTSTTREAEELSATLGRTIPVGFTASKVLAFAREDPEGWDACAHVLLPHDYVNYKLTDRITSEAGDASGTGYFDPVTRQYDTPAMAAIDPRLAERVPVLLAANESAGALTLVAATWLGLGAAAVGVPVSAGGGDNMLSAIGSGATRSGTAVVSLGTSGTVFTRSDVPVIDPSGAIAAFCDSTGAWLPLLCVMNATSVAEEVARAFGTDHATLTREAAALPAGNDGLLMVPYLMGERTPDRPNATGSLHGLRPGGLARGALYRAALEGVALNLAWGVHRMRELDLRIDKVRLVGGGSKNDLWASILASALHVTVERPVESESAALGAALQSQWVTHPSASIDDLAQVAVKIEGVPIEPNAADAAVYAERLGTFRKLAEG